jgi:hypothetical protein
MLVLNSPEDMLKIGDAEVMSEEERPREEAQTDFQA